MNPELPLDLQIQILQSENAELKAKLKAIGDIINPPPKPRDTTVGGMRDVNDVQFTPPPH